MVSFDHNCMVNKAQDLADVIRLKFIYQDIIFQKTIDILFEFM